jgi:hypothetical protein
MPDTTTKRNQRSPDTADVEKASVALPCPTVSGYAHRGETQGIINPGLSPTGTLHRFWGNFRVGGD